MNYGFQLASVFDPARTPKNAAIDVKEDGVAAIFHGPSVTLYGRDRRRLTPRYPDVAPWLPRNATLVLELCVFDWGPPRLSRFENGITQRMHLQQMREIGRRSRTYPVAAYVYDLLELDGTDVTRRPLRERGALLEGLLPAPIEDAECVPRVILAEQYPFSELARLQEAVSSAGMEGLVVKDIDAPYVATPPTGKRTNAYAKLKFWKTDVRAVLRWETTDRDGFVVYVPTGEGEQKVALNDVHLQGRVRAGAAHVRVSYLQETKSGQLRQPWIAGLA